MSKHTPGPWAVNNEEVPPIVFSIETQEMVACLSSDDVYADCWHREEWGKYNAFLIAAAPDMYEEMRRYLPVLERLEAEPELWFRFTEGTGIATLNGYRHALRKAEGEEE